MIPQNEAGVLVLFAQQAHAHGLTIVKAQQGFPDLIVQDEQGNEFRVELEYAASNFILHGHDLRECDVVVCWVSDKDLLLPVISLQEQWEMVKPEQLPDEQARELAYWKIRTQVAEGRLARCGSAPFIGGPADKQPYISLDVLGQNIIEAAMAQAVWAEQERMPSRGAMGEEIDWLTQPLWNSARSLLKMMDVHTGHRWVLAPKKTIALLHSAHTKDGWIVFKDIAGKAWRTQVSGQAVGGYYIFERYTIT